MAELIPDLWQIAAAIGMGLLLACFGAAAHLYWFWRTLDRSDDDHTHHD